MTQFIPEIRQIVIGALALALWFVLSGLLNFAIGHKSQINDWAEKRPYLAAALKFARSVGFDPWMLAQAWSLAVSKKLPPALQPPPPEGESRITTPPPPLRVPPIGPAMLCLAVALLLLSSCHPQNPACSEEKLATIVLQCRERVKTECTKGPDGKPAADCPALKECDALIDQWEAC